MTFARFDRTPRHRPVSLTPDVALMPGRAHEACGLSRRTFAAWLAGRMEGPVFWIAPAWESDPLNPAGLAAFAEPGRFTFLHPRRDEDVLWCMEETLRAGAIPLVVADLPGPPGLTAVRRLHLAAETGATQGAGVTPLALMLTPDAGGASGVETRWHMTPAHQPPAAAPFGAALHGRWRLTRQRARTAPPAAWWVTGLPQRLETAPCPDGIAA
ncbi:ImuA family protein [Pseudaestuariivita atlantica]|uniref:Protein ImuA n=1 Tax=Pseudaestuariivita atlantica TaxID=1317121 RepID=A0A0L1JR79_9RHOB|nr:hypothetical protein [Pseudaestuariivita atlantica]KNG94250.1 hypothetical protein ATO11_08540 [Pseudaestuariivita atlantica]